MHQASDRSWANMVEITGLAGVAWYLAITGDTITGTVDRMLSNKWARYLVPAVAGAGLFHLILEAESRA